MLLFNLIFQMKVEVLSSWIYLVNGGSYQTKKTHFLWTITLETQQLIVIRRRSFYELCLNGFKNAKQKEIATAKILRWQHKLVKHLSEFLNSSLSWALIEDLLGEGYGFALTSRFQRKMIWAILTNQWWKVFSWTARRNFILENY